MVSLRHAWSLEPYQEDDMLSCFIVNNAVLPTKESWILSSLSCSSISLYFFVLFVLFCFIVVSKTGSLCNLWCPGTGCVDLQLFPQVLELKACTIMPDLLDSSRKTSSPPSGNLFYKFTRDLCMLVAGAGWLAVDGNTIMSLLVNFAKTLSSSYLFFLNTGSRTC